MLIAADRPHEHCDRLNVINEIFGKRWTILILAACLDGSTRFSELADLLPIAPDILSRRLTNLIALGVLERQPYREPGTRGRHRYHLTPMGRQLDPVIRGALAWAARL